MEVELEQARLLDLSTSSIDLSQSRMWIAADASDADGSALSQEMAAPATPSRLAAEETPTRVMSPEVTEAERIAGARARQQQAAAAASKERRMRKQAERTHETEAPNIFTAAPDADSDGDGSATLSPPVQQVGAQELNSAALQSLEALYATYCPSKLSDAPELLSKYIGREDQLLRLVRAKYCPTKRSRSGARDRG